MMTLHANRLLHVPLSSHARFGISFSCVGACPRLPLTGSSKRAVLLVAQSSRGCTKPHGLPSTRFFHSRHNSHANESLKRSQRSPCLVSKSRVPLRCSLPCDSNSNHQLPNVQGTIQFAALRIYHSCSNQKPPPRNRFTAGLAGLATGSVILASKGKYLLSALKLTKFASLSSMLLTVGAYTTFYGFPYAVGMTSLILIHESGHALVMKRLGIPFSPMVFIPFMGAAVAMKKQPRDAYQEALVAFGGPVLGSVGALGFAGVGQATGSDLLIALADFGFMINLFNMIPLGMMDGGRICGAVSPYTGLVGLALGGTMAYQGMIHNPIIYLILMAGGYETFMRLYDPVGHAPTANYYRISSGKRSLITGGYFGLVGALFAAMAWNRQYMVPPERLKRRQDLLEQLG